MNSKIETNIDSGYTFNFGKYISKGWKLLASNAGTFIVFVLILAVVSIVVNIIPIIGIIASLLIITPAFAAGYYFLAREADVEGYTNLNTGFRGFNLLGKIIPVVLLKLLMLLASLIPFFLVVGAGIVYWYLEITANPSVILDNSLEIPSVGLIGFLLLLPSLYLHISYMFALPLVIFKDLGPWDAMETSRKLITKKWLAFFGLVFVAGFLSGLGIILLFIGLLFTASLTSLVMYAAYEDIVGFENEEDGDEIGHLIA